MRNRSTLFAAILLRFSSRHNQMQNGGAVIAKYSDTEQIRFHGLNCGNYTVNNSSTMDAVSVISTLLLRMPGQRGNASDGADFSCDRIRFQSGSVPIKVESLHD
jgi:hypothetical protein